MSASQSGSTALPTTGALSPDWVEVLYEVTRQFGSSLDLDEVLGKVLDLTVKAVGATVGSIFLLDADGRVVRAILARRNLPPEVKHYAVQAAMSQGFAGWLYQNRRAGVVADTLADPRWHLLPDETRPMRSALGAPLIRRDKVIGIITLTHLQPGHFTRRQLELLEAIAGQAASAVENAALYTRVRNERSMLQAVIAGVYDIILVTDLKDRLILVNPAARRQLALPDSAAGRPFAEAVPDPALRAFYQAAHEQADSLGQVALEDGRVFDCALALVAGVGRVLGMHDVTAFKVLDEMKSEFVSQVSHDLKAPLGIIYGYAQLLSDTPGLDSEGRTYVQMMLSTVDRMQALIDSLLDLGQIDMGVERDTEALDPAAIVESAVAGLRALAQDKRITVSVAAAGPLPRIRGSRVRLEQAVANLVDNAIKFTPQGGTVSVRAVHEPGEQAGGNGAAATERTDESGGNGAAATERTDESGGNGAAATERTDESGGNGAAASERTDALGGIGAPAGEIVIRVSDSGPGIPVEARGRLFQKFSRLGLDKANEGHGLGLSIVKSVVDAHGGRVWVEAETGQGSTFVIALPAENPPD